MCANRLPLCLYVYHAFSLVPSLTLSYSNMVVFIYIILFYYYSLNTCLFSKEKQKGSRWEGQWKGTGRSREGKQESEHTI